VSTSSVDEDWTFVGNVGVVVIVFAAVILLSVSDFIQRNQ
jgi:hypothetical protein